MRKIVTLFLALVLCLSFVACGAKDGYSEETVIGTWNSEYEYGGDLFYYNGEPFNPGDSMEFTMDVFKGGTMEILRVDTKTGAEIKSSGTWELNDGVLVVSYGEVTAGFEIVSEEEMMYQGTNHAFPKSLYK